MATSRSRATYLAASFRQNEIFVKINLTTERLASIIGKDQSVPLVGILYFNQGNAEWVSGRVFNVMLNIIITTAHELEGTGTAGAFKPSAGLVAAFGIKSRPIPALGDYHQD
jgi:hypothetical protein